MKLFIFISILTYLFSYVLTRKKTKEEILVPFSCRSIPDPEDCVHEPRCRWDFEFERCRRRIGVMYSYPTVIGRPLIRGPMVFGRPFVRGPPVGPIARFPFGRRFIMKKKK